MDSKETLSNFIERKTKQWVGRNFGSQEVEDPSWDIKNLSKYLADCLELKGVKLSDTDPYELTVLLYEDSDTSTGISSVVDIIERFGGRVVSSENEGRKRLAYKINNEEFAQYIYMNVELPKDASAKISAALSINGVVLRYLLVKADRR